MQHVVIPYSLDSIAIYETDTDEIVADKLRQLFTNFTDFKVGNKRIISGLTAFDISFSSETYSIVISRTEKNTFDFIQQQHLQHVVFFHDNTPSFALIKVIQHADADLLTINELDIMCGMVKIARFTVGNNRFYSKVARLLNRQEEINNGI